MDSRLLAGAYSKRYRYIEREHIENVNSDGSFQSNDVLAKARRLSQETNKRRKLLAQKRKQEAAREEKRRQDILNKRHQEQKQATEKYQRCHVGNRPRLSPSPRRRGHSPTRNHVNIEDALRLIRGGSTSSVPNEQSREAIQRMQQNQENGRDPLERSHMRSSRAGSAGQRESRQSHNRPLSGRPLDASMRAQLMERSMRNLTSSRSRFEQQLEQHQQLLVEQQQKSLHDFNQAIRKEIDADTKVQGLEENETQDVPLRSESLSSLDSLEEGDQSLNSSLQEQQAQRNFHQQREEMQTQGYNDMAGTMMTQQQRPEQPPEDRIARPQSGKVPITRLQQNSQRHTTGQSQADTISVAGNAHIIGPIPQGYHTPQVGVPVSSTPVIHGNLNCYTDCSGGAQTTAERHVTVGTALRLPQQSPPVSQPLKQPPPTLQYDSQLLAHRKFDAHPNQNSGVPHRNTYQQEVNTKYSTSKVLEELTSALTQNEHPKERPKAHIYAWTSPPPEESEQYPNTVSSTGYSGNNSGSYSASMVADRVMATNLHPQTCRAISTAATTTCVYQTVNPAPTREAAYAQASIHNMTSTQQAGLGTNSSQVEIPRGQGQKPGTILTAAGTYPAMTGLKFIATAPPSYKDYMQASENRQQQNNPQGSHSHYPNQNQSESGMEPQQTRDGSLAQGTVGVVNGRLTTVSAAQEGTSQQEQKITVVEDQTDDKKEVRSILKKVNKDMLKAGGQTKFNVQDSLEIAKMHMRTHEQVKRKKVQKKGVRFADLHYPEQVDEDTDSADSMIDVNAAAINTNSSNTNKAADGKMTGAKGTAQKSRPVSARVSNTSRTADSRSRVPRAASAGPSRNPQAARPKAAAHIIMSGEAINPTSQHGGQEAGITAHKSQLQKKVMLINNNFMSRVPMYSSSSTAEIPTAAAAVYATSGGKGGNTVAADSDSVGGHGKTLTFSQPSEQVRVSRGKAVASTPHATVLPSHSHFSNANNMHKALYNENGLRMDRTPTDDEINSLWKNMRTMLDVNEGKGVALGTSAANNNDARQQVQVSHQYIDGASLGMPSGMRRMAGYTTNSKPSTVNGTQNGTFKSEGQTKNGYLQRYSLLQQRKNPRSGMGASCRTNDVVEQTVQPMPISTNASDPRHAAVNVSYAPREEMSESMAGFLAAEQTIQSQGADIRDSRVVAAMESAQNQQEMYNSIRQKFAKGGPSALSLEEHQLLESLDKLNDRLKAVENRQTSNQQTSNYSNNPNNHQIFIHGSGFRGHQVITSQSYRRNSGGQRSVARPVSARLLTRPYR